DSIAARKARQLSELSAVREEENDLRMRAASSSLDVDKEVALNRRMAQIDARHRDSTLSYAHKLALPKKVDRPDDSQVEKVEETFEDDEQKDDVDAGLLTTMSKGKQTIPEKQPTKLEQDNFAVNISVLFILPKDMLKHVLERTRDNIVQPQVVGHREYHGPGFKCNPSSIWFKKSRSIPRPKRQIEHSSLPSELDRVGLIIRICNVLLVLCCLRHVLSFSPPGVLSPGMSCPLEVTFLSKLDRDLYGHLNFLTPNGPFSIPFKATTKKCEKSQLTEREEQSQQSTDIGAGKDVDHRELKSSEPSYATLDFALEELSEFECGDLTQGYLGPFGSVTLDIIWHPKYVYHRDEDNLPTLLETEKFVVQFDNPCCQPIEIFAQGTPKDLPTWLSTSTMVMGICWYDRLYQDCFAVNNRKTTALKVTFHWDNRISNHLEILPKTGYVQVGDRLVQEHSAN
ncbi:uncharacterized protein DEA37_0013705, partial [Paragonimus westermani]